METSGALGGLPNIPGNIQDDIAKLEQFKTYAEQAGEKHKGLAKAIMKLVGHIRDLFTHSSRLKRIEGSIANDIKEIRQYITRHPDMQSESLNRLLSTVKGIEKVSERLTGRITDRRRTIAGRVDQQLQTLDAFIAGRIARLSSAGASPSMPVQSEPSTQPASETASVAEEEGGDRDVSSSGEAAAGGAVAAPEEASVAKTPAAILADVRDGTMEIADVDKTAKKAIQQEAASMINQLAEDMITALGDRADEESQAESNKVGASTPRAHLEHIALQGKGKNRQKLEKAKRLNGFTPISKAFDAYYGKIPGGNEAVLEQLNTYSHLLQIVEGSDKLYNYGE